MPEVDPEEMTAMAMELCGKEDQMRAEISNAYIKFTSQFSKESIAMKRNPDIDPLILKCACFCALGRMGVERDGYHKTVEYKPAPEGPARLAKQLMSLGWGIAMAQGKDQIDGEIYPILKEVARSLIPAPRKMMLEFLWQQQAFEHTSEWRKTAEIADAIGFPRSTTIYLGEDLTLAGLLTKRLMNDEKDDDRRNPYQWQLNERAYEQINTIRFFDNVSIPF